MSRTSHCIAALACLAAVTACEASIVAPRPGPSQAGPDGNGAIDPPASCQSASPPHVPMHRLTNDEYDHTVADLLYTQLRPAQAFDPDRIGTSGYVNDSNTLPLSDDLTTAWYGAAEQLAAEFIASKASPSGAYGRYVDCGASTACAQTVIAKLASRAFRRPVSGSELAALMTVFNADADFDLGLEDTLIAVLMSPKFLFVSTTDAQSQDPDATFPVDDYALASRLSYALWQTMPDDELFALAGQGQLRDPDTLAAQVRRMLATPERMTGFLKTFRDDWAQAQNLATTPLNGLDDATRLGMVGELDAFLSDLLAGDRSLLNLLTARYTFVNAPMAAYYGLPFSGSDPSAFMKVDLPADRLGLVLSPAVLTVTALDTDFTHPVHRGKWVAQSVLCAPPPPPPPNVPSINPDPTVGGTPREKLAVHTNREPCHSCHQLMDTLGLGLENYDPFGQWRDTYGSGGPAIDASGTLPDGTSFTQPVQMVTDLAAGSQAQSCLARQLMAYLVMRPMTAPGDACASQTLAQVNVTPDSKLSDLVVAIVSSPQFLQQTGEAP
jgi:hypothetical protein